MITHLGTERSIGLSSAWLTLQTSPSNSDFCKKNWKRADMTSRLIGSGLSNRPSSPVRAKVKCCKSHDLFGCQIKDCSAIRIPSLSITGRHPWPTGSFIGFFFLPLCRGAVGVFYSPIQGIKMLKIFLVTGNSYLVLMKSSQWIQFTQLTCLPTSTFVISTHPAMREYF